MASENEMPGGDPGEMRDAEDRRGEDRRKDTKPYTGPERRKHERRSVEDPDD
ncbi:hypothetical protein [Qipengyuania sp. JC766]|uniref:hypothetical protein n=1 Tax=Qipengyuania sp. JC766 TaxID=3232139 RepID=UPI003458E19D